MRGQPFTWRENKNAVARHGIRILRTAEGLGYAFARMNSVIFGHTISRQRRPEKMP